MLLRSLATGNSALGLRFAQPSSLRRCGLQVAGLPCRSLIIHSQNPSSRNFSSSRRTLIEQKDVFPTVSPSTAPHIQRTETAWKHPVFTEVEMEKISVSHRDTQSFSDKIALNAIRFLRWGMDTATGYKHPEEVPAGATSSKKFEMTESKWLVRFIFLESVAGVPGMVGGMLRHLHSLRRMKRDNGWIETLIEESFNERMHLLTFLKLHTPGIFMRTMILGAQGVFFNGFFICYLLSPRTCHRFVGYLEEEAVRTYTRAISDLDAGKLPLWTCGRVQAPEIAVGYWDMPEGKRGMRELLMYIRADEAKHREVNHTLGNLDQNSDPNPFASVFKDESKPHPSKRLEGSKGVGWDREEAL
ncbi:mitochondrial alternative oxidase [Leptodontidium sp. 2 PMI_412]|nr:mitochondrial alternative oxidase [Leptodontidium sp. 2 PMI_412]